jgi:hypothetical protein
MSSAAKIRFTLFRHMSERRQWYPAAVCLGLVVMTGCRSNGAGGMLTSADPRGDLWRVMLAPPTLKPAKPGKISTSVL